MSNSRDLSFEALADMAPWPNWGTQGIETIRAERKWRCCALAIDDVPPMIRALLDFADSELRREWDKPVPCRVSVRKGHTTWRIQGPGPVELKPDGEAWDAASASRDAFVARVGDGLRQIEDLREVDEIRVVIGDNLWLLAALVFQKRSPGARVIAHGLSEDVPFYPDVAESFTREAKRLLKGKVDLRLWTLIAPSLLVPRLLLNGPGERADPSQDRAKRIGVFVLGAAATAVIGLAVAWLAGWLFG